MKRLIPVLAVVASVVALPFSHLVLAGPGGGGQNKVKLCHITGQPAQKCEVARAGNPSGDCLVGHVIEVAAPAVDAHCAHGDHLNINPTFEKGDDCERPVEWTVDDNCDAVAPTP